MTKRRLWALVLAAALLAASCDTAAEVTTTTEEPVTTTTAAPAPGRVPLQPNGPPIIIQGDRGAYVEALQFYLVCAGLSQPDPEGPVVSVDGSYGPITAFAVAYFQAQVRRAPSGEPDDETFAMLARECGERRVLVFPVGEAAVEIAGNAAPSDDEVFTVEGTTGQVLGLTAVEGSVEIAVEDAEGAVLASSVANVDAELPSAGQYLVRVSAGVPTTFRLVAEVRSPNVLVSEFGPMALRHDGAGVAEFGVGTANASAVISLVLGTAWTDSGLRSDVAACPGTHQAITWLIQAGSGNDLHPAVFTAYFGEVSNEVVFLQYAYRSLDLTALDPLAQGLATREGISIGSTLEQFVEAYGDLAIDDQGRVTLADGLIVVFDLAGDAASPDPQSSRVRSIEAGRGGCEEL